MSGGANNGSGSSNGTGQGASSQSMPAGARAPVILRISTMPCQGKKRDDYEWDGKVWVRETTKTAFFLRLNPQTPEEARERVFVIAANDPNCPSRSVLEDIVSW